MKCPVCVEQGLRSTVTPGRCFQTLMAHQSYYDKDGNYHFHDPNEIRTSYSCSNGHKWKTIKHVRCPVDRCSFNDKLPADKIERMDDGSSKL